MKSSFSVNTRFIPYTLQFKFDAGTSRGVLTKKKNYFVECRSDNFPGWVGYGEAGPLIGLSIDDIPDFDIYLNKILQEVERVNFSIYPNELLQEIERIVPANFPSVRFALETAMLDLTHGGKRKLMPNDFYDKETPIPINGLVWMGDKHTMWNQVEEKLAAGFECIKIKIGALDFNQECELLGQIRNKFPSPDISIRVDANGAFSPDEAMGKLQQLASYNLHSIEQPIRQGNIEEMSRLCSKSPIPIALDEELIGINSSADKIKLLETTRPQFIIVKPTLLGGILASREWIRIAEKLGIGWWITSALESNIGLNAIAQFTATYTTGLPQGLGTGQLYDNNILSPLTISKGALYYGEQTDWGDIAGLFS